MPHKIVQVHGVCLEAWNVWDVLAYKFINKSYWDDAIKTR